MWVFFGPNQDEKDEELKFNFDIVFYPESEQAEVFEFVALPFIKGLLHEDCVAMMRLMSLVDLGSSESGHIPYDIIKCTLQIADDEVEGWVVKAITAKLLDFGALSECLG